MNDYKVMSLHVMLSKVSAYFKSYDGYTNWMHFLIEGDDLLKNIMLFGIKSVLILKRNLIASLSTIKSFWKPK